jgi:hypothetical protein
VEEQKERGNIRALLEEKGPQGDRQAVQEINKVMKAGWSPPNLMNECVLLQSQPWTVKR